MSHVQKVMEDIKKKSGDVDRVKDLSFDLQNVLNVSVTRWDHDFGVYLQISYVLDLIDQRSRSRLTSSTMSSHVTELQRQSKAKQQSCSSK